MIDSMRDLKGRGLSWVDQVDATENGYSTRPKNRKYTTPEGYLRADDGLDA